MRYNYINKPKFVEDIDPWTYRNDEGSALNTKRTIISSKKHLQN
jgi:hypothetical protein